MRRHDYRTDELPRSSASEPPGSNRRHVAQRLPGDAIDRSIPVSRHHLAVVGEHDRAALVRSTERPHAIARPRLIDPRPAVAVKKMCFEDVAAGVVADNLDAFALTLADAAVPPMEHVEAARQPFICVLMSNVFRQP